MRINFELPRWAEDRNLYIFAGSEVVARKKLGGPLEVKTVRCNLCGECCRHCPPDWPLGQTDGVCDHLKYEKIHHGDGRVEEGWFCKFKPRYLVPFTCCKGDYEDPEKCCIRFEAVK